MTYRREKVETEGMLAQLPDESKLVALRHDVVVDMATALDRVSAEERKRTVALFVDRVAPDGEVTWAKQIAPLYAVAAGGMREVSPEGLEPSTR